MAILTAPTFCFAHGDTWPMPITYRNPNNADGTPGAPIDLTGSVCSGNLFLAYQGEGQPMTVQNGRLVVDPTNGLMTFTLDEFVSATAIADRSPKCGPFLPYNYKTRLQVIVRDTSGKKETIAVFPIYVFDPKTVDPSTFPTQQSGSVISVSQQGPPGAAGITSINGYTGSIVTLGAHDVGTLTTAEIQEAIETSTGSSLLDAFNRPIS